MASQVPQLKLNNGVTVPVIGLGTWNSPQGEVEQAVKDAIDAGYRHIDCAWAYGNEKEVGDGIKAKIADGTVKREDLFITSKLWNTYHSTDLVLPAMKDSLRLLGLSYLDLYLIHWPIGYKERCEKVPRDANGKIQLSDVDYLEAWLAVEQIQKLGLARAIGVSNFNHEQIDRILAKGSVVPAMCQIECHPNLPQVKLVEYCKSKGIAVTTYCPLGSPKRPWAKEGEPVLMEDPRLVTIAKKHNKTTAQVLIKWQLQRGLVCIPKSVTKSRIQSNFQVWDFELSNEEMSTIVGMDTKLRLVHLDWVNDSKYYPFHIEY